MEQKNLYCFIELNIEYISIAICKIEDRNKITIQNFIKEEFLFNDIRYKEIFEKEEIFEKLIYFINKLEKEQNLIIDEIIIISQSNQFTYLLTNIEMKLHGKLISSKDREFLHKKAIKFFNQSLEEQGNFLLIDTILFNYKINQNILVANPEKMSAEKLSLSIGGLGIKESYSKNLLSYLEKYKIRQKHIISSDVAIFYLLKNNSKFQDFTLLINFSNIITSYSLIKDGIILHQGNINLGFLDIIRDIAIIFKLNINSAKNLYNSINDFANKDPSFIIEIDNSFIQFEELKNVIKARQNEIFNIISKQISENFEIDKIKEAIIYTKNYIFLDEIIYNIFSINYSKIEKFISEVELSKLIKNPIENLNILGGILFYSSNLQQYKKLKKGFFFNPLSKISCFLKEILY